MYQRDHEEHIDHDDDDISLYDEDGNYTPRFTKDSSEDSSAIPQDPYKLTTAPNENKRSLQQAEFSSPEESPAYKKLLEKFEKEQEIQRYTANCYHDIRKQYEELKNSVDELQHESGSSL